ncbi:MAG: T9SS type A sorting domain-containing protein, partial [Ignavibacteria bacterium]|nr:T9SS type A sorting domain-containing protein [Ignavibacteria bacterium]
TILYKGPWLKNIRGIGALTFYKLPISAIVNITEGNHIPKEFMLYPNFPNPFNPETKIQFDVPTAGRVKLEIFDILGKSSELPVDETLRPGRYNIVWSAEEYSSGIYFYRLSAGNFVQTRKMIVVK